MVEVHVQLYSILREKLPPEARGRTVLQLKANSSLDAILRELDINRRVVISVNGEYEPDRSRSLRDGDEVKIFSSVSGGSPAAQFELVESERCRTVIMERSCT